MNRSSAGWMLKLPHQWLTVSCAIWSLCSVHAADMVFRPVASTGPYTIDGTEIKIQPGAQRIFLEHRLRGFGPNFLDTYQGKIDSSGFASGAAGVLGPAYIPCPSEGLAGNLFCRTQMNDSGVDASECVSDYRPAEGVLCEPAWINRSQSDWVFLNLFSISIVDLRFPFRWGATTISRVFDTGNEYYGADLAIDVPVEARGTFVIRFVEAESFLVFFENDQPNYIEPVFFLPAKITIACTGDADCDDGNPCTDDLCEPDGDCVHTASCMTFDFVRCIYGPRIPIFVSCFPFDINADGVVDLLDVADLTNP